MRLIAEQYGYTAIYVLAGLILLYLLWYGIKTYRHAGPKQKPILMSVYLGVLAGSLLLFIGFKYSGISEHLFPNYYAQENIPAPEDIFIVP